MPKRTRQQVIVDEISRGDDDPLVVVRGGMFPRGMVWLPGESSDVVTQTPSHDTFISISATDPAMQQLSGCSLINNGMLVDLLKARNEACEEVLTHKTKEHFGNVVFGNSPTKQTALKATMAKEHEDKLPQTVRIDVKGREMDALFTVDKRKCATVKLTSENLDFIARKCAEENGVSDTRRKTPKAQRMEFSSVHITLNPQRQQACVRYTDADGKPRYHGVPLKFDPDDQELNERRKEAAQTKLMTFYNENHHPNLCNDIQHDECGDAAEVDESDSGGAADTLDADTMQHGMLQSEPSTADVNS